MWLHVPSSSPRPTLKAFISGMASISLPGLCFFLPAVVSILAILNLILGSPRPFHFLHSCTPYSYSQKSHDITLLELHFHLKSPFCHLSFISRGNSPSLCKLNLKNSSSLKPPFPFLLSGNDVLQQCSQTIMDTESPGILFKMPILSQVWCAWWCQCYRPHFETYFE